MYRTAKYAKRGLQWPVLALLLAIPATFLICYPLIPDPCFFNLVPLLVEDITVHIFRYCEELNVIYSQLAVKKNGLVRRREVSCKMFNLLWTQSGL